MSYGVMAYLVDTQALLNTPARVLFEEVNLKCARELREIDSMLEDHSEQVSASDLLKELLSGEGNRAGLGFAYGYLFKSICEIKGQFLNNSAWYPCDMDNLYDIPFTSMLDMPYKFPIPDDFPAIFSIAPESINTDEADYGELDETQIAQLESWFSEAKMKNQHLYIFLH